MYREKTPEDKIKEIERKIHDLYSEISTIKQQIGFSKQSYNNNLVERIERLEILVGEPSVLLNYPMENNLRILNEMVGTDGVEHTGEKTRHDIIIFRIVIELKAMRDHLSALQGTAERGGSPDGMDEDNMKKKDQRMNKLKGVLLDALGIINLGVIIKIIELCHRCYNTPVKEPAGFTPGNFKLKDRGTRELVKDIDSIITKLSKEINYDEYVKKIKGVEN